MSYEELICRAAREAQEAQAGIGVRLSPVRLTAAEATALAAVAREALGPSVYVSIAAPGVQPWEDARTCLSDGERAAERATAWRNLARPEDGEWILYVSVERLGRAGGLHDTLRAIDEASLREALLREGQDQGIPAALVQALEESGVAARVPARALAALQEAVAAASPEDRWEEAGRNLPLLGLAADSGLREQTAERLKGNLRLVREASAREARGAAGKDSLQGAIAEALSGEGGAEALARVDLGEVATEQLAPPRRPRAPRASRTSPGARGPRAPKAQASPEAGAAPAIPPLTREPPAAFTSAGSIALDPTPAEAPPGGQISLLKRSAPAAAPWEEARIPSSTAALVAAALQGGGEGLAWTLRAGSPREALLRPPEGLARAALIPCEPQDPASRAALATWGEARAALLAALEDAGVDRAALSRLPTLPSAALRAVGLAAEALSRAASDALSVMASRDPAALPAALSRDAVYLHNPSSGEALLMPTPLHPLALGAALSRDATWREATDAPESVQGPIVWWLSRPIPAPLRWPAPDDGALLAGAPLAGLPVFETRPTAHADDTLLQAARDLTLRLLELCPHAQLGLRLAVEADRCGPILDGIAAALEADSAGPSPRATVYASSAPALSDRAGVAVTAGLLTLAPLPSAPEARAALAPHLEIRVPPPPPPEPGDPWPSPAPGPLPRLARRASPAGWAACAPASALFGGEAIQVAVGAALGEPTAGAFVSWSPVVSLPGDPPRDRATWRAALGAQLGPPPRSGPLVFLQERLPDAWLAVMSQDLRAVGRALVPSFAALGVRDLRPSQSEALARQLARATGGVLPLCGALGGQLTTRVLRRVVAERLGADSVVAVVPGAGLRAVDRGLRDPRGPVVLGACLGRRLQIVIGHAISARGEDAQLPEEATALFGALGGWCARVGQADALAGAAARALLEELLWPALASLDEPAPLRALLAGAAAAEVTVSAVALAPPDACFVGKSVSAGELAVEVLALDQALLQRVLLGP